MSTWRKENRSTSPPWCKTLTSTKTSPSWSATAAAGRSNGSWRSCGSTLGRAAGDSGRRELSCAPVCKLLVPQFSAVSPRIHTRGVSMLLESVEQSDAECD